MLTETVSRRRRPGGIVIALLFLLAGTARGGPAPASLRADDIRSQAMAREQAGQPREAATLYESVIASDPAARPLLLPRIARLYAEAGATNKALDCARLAMASNPDPQAYLAGIHALLGDFAQARSIIERELAADPAPPRRLTLLWQLADVCERQGDLKAAESALGAALTACAGTPDEPAARRRLDRFRAAHEDAPQ